MTLETSAGTKEVRRRAGLVRADEAQTLLAGPVGAILMAGRADTAGAVSFVVHPLAPRALGAPLHTHRNEDEWSFVLEGEIGIQLGEDILIACPGDLVLKPRGVSHAFWNATDTPARMLEVITPAGFEGYFARLAEAFRTLPPDLNVLAAAAADYDLEIDFESIPRLAQAHGLSLT